MSDFESRLRATLAERAHDAPSSDALEDRILTEVSAPVRVLRPRQRWRTWTLPLLAAALVAGVVTSVLTLSHLHSSAGPKPPAMSQVDTPRPTVSPSPTPHPSKPSQDKTTKSQPTKQGGPPVNPDPNHVTGFRVTDLSFVGDKDGWALGTANCLSGPGRCTALFRTTDGTSWTSIGTTPFTVSGRECGDCVQHIRFANAATGYAYGPAALYMTVDGGLNWKPQPGRGAEALETLNDNVIRLVSNHAGCPGPCDVHAETSAVGSQDWTKVTLPGASKVFGYGAALSRGTGAAYALGESSLAAGHTNDGRTLDVSIDNGLSWTARTSPCSRFGSHYFATAAAGAGEVVSALCAKAGPHQGNFVAVSKDGGQRFAKLPHSSFHGYAAGLFAGDPNTELLAVGPHGLIRYSKDTGRWTRVDGVTGTPSFIGFESQTLGRVVTDHGRIVWTTHDGGKTWSPFRFS